MAKKSLKRSKQNRAKKVGDLPAGPKAKNVKGGRGGRDGNDYLSSAIIDFSSSPK